jgi:hypothetical protein
VSSAGALRRSFHVVDGSMNPGDADEQDWS